MGSHPIVAYAHDVCFMHSCMLNLVAAIISKDQAAKRFGEDWSLWRCACRACLSVSCKTRHPPEFC
jgi:hypothetical protein